MRRRVNPFGGPPISGRVIAAAGTAISVLVIGSVVATAGGNRMHVAGLPVIILHDVAVASVEDAGLAVTERSGVVARFIAATAGFDAH